MSLGSLLNSHEAHQLHSGANAAIWHSHVAARHAARSGVREEDFVASFVTVGVENIARRWEPILAQHGHRISIAGVFCHGRPQVKFQQNSTTCQVELADLLVVHCHRSRQRTQARAMLIQAKMSDDGTHPLSKSDEQLHLFSTWPAFSFVGRVLDSRQRTLKEVGRGSRYALIYKGQAFPEELDWPHQCPWSSCKAVNHLTSESSFASLITNMVLGKDGRTFSHSHARGEWSKTINDLLRVTGRRTFRAVRLWPGTRPRIVEATVSRTDDLVFFSSNSGVSTAPSASSIISSHFAHLSSPEGLNRPPNKPGRPERIDLKDEDGGVSTLVIETTAED